MKWKEGYRLGSTVFKEVKDKKGKVKFYRCAVCGDEYNTGYYWRTYESHEIMHMLQKILAFNVSGRDDELIFEGDEE